MTAINVAQKVSAQPARTWAVGYSTNKGLIALASDGKKIAIPTKKFGNMDAPDPEQFRDKFLSQLTAGDNVLTPSGPNYMYIAACSATGAQVYWIHPGHLQKDLEQAGMKKGDEPKLMLQMFKKDGTGAFYTYHEMDRKMQDLRSMVYGWLSTERQATASSNAYAQELKRKMDHAVYLKPEREAWVKKWVSEEMRKVRNQWRRVKLVPTKKQKEIVKEALTAHANVFYEALTDEDSENRSRNLELMKRAYMEWFGIDELLEECKKNAIAQLKTMPQNTLFDGLISGGTTRVRSIILAFVRSPLLYPNVRALLAYAGIGTITKGQAFQRKRGEPDKGHPTFKKTAVFDFAEKYWMNDKVGFFEQLYYAYKHLQYQMYWDLLQITADVYKGLGKKAEDGDVNAQFGETDEEKAARDQIKSSGDKTAFIHEIVDRLLAISDSVPMIGKNKAVMQSLYDLQNDESPDPKRLWQLFKRGPVAGLPAGDNKGFNICLTPARIEKRVKRYLGVTLVRALYYRWMKSLGMRAPLEDDHQYLSQYKTLFGTPCEPTGTDEHGLPIYPEYNHRVTLEYCKHRALLLEIDREDEGLATIPNEFKIEKFVAKKRRDDIEVATNYFLPSLKEAKPDDRIAEFELLVELLDKNNAEKAVA